MQLVGGTLTHGCVFMMLHENWKKNETANTYLMHQMASCWKIEEKTEELVWRKRDLDELKRNKVSEKQILRR